MGLLTASIRKQYLIGYKSDLEYKIQTITQAKMSLSSSVSDLLESGKDMDPENPAMKVLEQRRERLNLLEKKLDMQMNEYKEKLEMVEAEIKSCEGMFSKDLQDSFSYGK